MEGKIWTYLMWTYLTPRCEYGAGYKEMNGIYRDMEIVVLLRMGVIKMASL